MKKTYIEPRIETIVISPISIIANSPSGAYNGGSISNEGEENMETREFSFSDEEE